MATTIDVPDELLTLLGQSRLGGRPRAEQVRLALAMHLFQEGVVSIGRAAELAGEPRASFELLLGELGIPPARYDVAEYREQWTAFQQGTTAAPGAPVPGPTAGGRHS